MHFATLSQVLWLPPMCLRARAQGVRTIAARTSFACAVLILISTAACGQIVTVRDDFSGTSFNTANWFPCHRDENDLSIVAAPGEGFKAAKLVVRPRQDVAPFALGRHKECRREDGTAYPRGESDERAELWEADRTLLSFGREVWYRFSMYIDPDIPRTDNNRLVIGQWKSDGGHSPTVAQRFVNRQFTITIQQDNDAPNRHRDDTECRVIVAHDQGFSPTMSSVLPGVMSTFRTLGNGLVTASLGHDRFENAHGAITPAEPCARDLKIESFAPLPNAFGAWVTMLYRIRATADAQGVLEVWADDKPIVKVTGRIGYRDGRGGKQYFKFGPYRDHVLYSSYAMLAQFARGASRDDVK